MKYTIFSFAIIFTFFVGASYASAQSYAPGCEWLNPTPSCGGYGGGVTNSCGSPSNCIPLANGCYSCQCATITIQGKQLTSVGPGPTQCIPSYSGASCTTGYVNGFSTFCGSGASSGAGTPSSGGNRNYDINISPSIQSINQNDTVVYTITLVPEAGAFGSSVRLQLNTGDCPQGSTCSFVGGYTSGGIPMIGVTFGMDYSPVTATFTIQTSGSTPAPNTYSFRINSDVLLATGPSATAQLSVSAAQVLGATCSSFSAPNTVQAGQTFTGSFTMLNSGTKNWSALGWAVNGSSYLVSMPNWSTVWGPSGIALPSTPITPGSSATFSTTFTAPNTPGTYPFTFQMAELGTGMYGSQCTKNITVTSTPPPPSGNPPTLVIDAPASGATVSGNVTLSGWALDNTSASETAISAVRVYLDGVLLGNATITNRQDVCNIWNRPGCPNVGWTYSWNSALTSNGTHTIRVDATDSDSTPQTSSVSRSVTVSNVVTPAPTVTLSATPSSVTSGSSATISWTVANATSCTNVGTDSIPNANWTSGTTGSVSSGAITSQRNYRLSCTGAGGTTLSNIQTVTISSNSESGTISTIISGGCTTEPCNIITNVTSTGVDNPPNTIKIYRNGTFLWDKPANTSDPVSGYQIDWGVTAGVKNYCVRAARSNGTISDDLACSSVTIGNAIPPTTVTITSNPNSGTAPVTPSLTWSSTGASSCTASGGWSGTQPTSGNITLPDINTTTTYTITCGSAVSQTTITVNPPSSTYYNLNIIKSGRGTVTVNELNSQNCPPGRPCANRGDIVLFECGTTCNGSLEQDKRVNVRALVEPNRIFVGWSGVTCSEGNQRSTACSFRMNSDKTIYANFVVDPNYKEF